MFHFDQNIHLINQFSGLARALHTRLGSADTLPGNPSGAKTTGRAERMSARPEVQCATFCTGDAPYSTLPCGGRVTVSESAGPRSFRSHKSRSLYFALAKPRSFHSYRTFWLDSVRLKTAREWLPGACRLRHPHYRLVRRDGGMIPGGVLIHRDDLGIGEQRSRPGIGPGQVAAHHQR